MLPANLDDGLVPVPLRAVIAASRVEVPRGELGGVRSRVVPPVHPRALDGERGIAGSRPAAEHGPRASKHAIAVSHELARVPRQEKLAVLRVPRSEVRAEKPSLVREVVVPARVVRSRASPLDVSSLRPRPGEVAQRALIVALKLADARELPLRRPGRNLILRVRRVSKFAARPAPDGHLAERLHEVGVDDGFLEGRHEVSVTLQRRSSLQRHGVIRPQRDALRVSIAVLIGEEEIGVVLGGAEHPPRERHLEVIPHVGAARVKAHHRVELQPGVAHHPEEFQVRRPVVQLRSLSLDDAPPHVDHHPLHANLLQRVQRRAKRLHVLQRAVAADDVQGQHHENRRGALAVREIVLDGKSDVAVQRLGGVQHPLEVFLPGGRGAVRRRVERRRHPRRLRRRRFQHARVERREMPVPSHLLRQRGGEVIHRHQQVHPLLGR